MLDDRTFLTSVAALEAAADRLGQQTVTIQTDHLRRLREMAERAGPRRQAAPVPGEGDVWAEVIADGERRGSIFIPPRVLDLMRERRQVGIDRYGVPLQRGNGRDGMRDLLEELLDAVAYSALCGRPFGILVDLISMLDSDMRAKG